MWKWLYNHKCLFICLEAKFLYQSNYWPSYLSAILPISYHACQPSCFLACWILPFQILIEKERQLFWFWILKKTLVGGWVWVILWKWHKSFVQIFWLKIMTKAWQSLPTFPDLGHHPKPVAEKRFENINRFQKNSPSAFAHACQLWKYDGFGKF